MPILFIFRVLIVLTIYGTHMFCTILQYDHQNEYEGFLNLVDKQLEKDDLKNDEVFFTKPIYGIDRHGRQFVKCVEHNSTASTRSKSVRCPTIGSTDLPGCFAMYDGINDELIQGCYNYQKEYAETCEKHASCSIRVLKRKIGFCCCVGDRCNDRKKVLFRGTTLDEALTTSNRII